MTTNYDRMVKIKLFPKTHDFFFLMCMKEIENGGWPVSKINRITLEKINYHCILHILRPTCCQKVFEMSLSLKALSFRPQNEIKVA